MKLINNNLSPLPFYDDIELQNHRKSYAYGNFYPLVLYRNMLLPFQMVIDSESSSINWVRLYDYNTGKYADITSSMKESGLVISSFSGFKVIKYPALFPIMELQYEGTYYLAINITGQGTIYSDLFTSCNNINDYLLLEYKNSYNFSLYNGAVDFDGFAFRCYLPTQIGKPDYEFEEEATVRMGYTFVESQVSKKVYKFNFLAPEYLCDALRIVRMCDIRTITSKKQVYKPTSFEIQVSWEEQGDLASVTCSFETDNVIANIGGYKPTAQGGDFNNDFNNDYKIQ